MADVFSKEVRSFIMSKIKGRDTKPELLIRKFLFKNGFRYRLYDKTKPGKPDIVLPKYKKVIFIHGCYWHGHEGCKDFVVPKTDTAVWLKKFENNKKNDSGAFTKLEKEGWTVITIWECELKPKVKEKTLNNLIKDIKSDNTGN
jgi:DNA mismatch endonuclease, patch repair protein